MASLATCIGIALILAVYAHWKGRTAWHWFVLSAFAYAVIWILTVVALDLAGVEVWLGSHKLALFVGTLTGALILIILISVPERPGRHLLQARRDPAP
jgi:hypothetical protein